MSRISRRVKVYNPVLKNWTVIDRDIGRVVDRIELNDDEKTLLKMGKLNNTKEYEVVI